MTQEQRDWLEKNNLDPTIYDIDAEGNVFENPVERMSKMRAALTSAAASTVPSLGGVAGAIPGAELGATLLAPLGPVGMFAGGVIGGLAGAFGGSYLTQKAQQAALEKYAPSALEEVARAQEEQPGASFVGGLAPTALTMRPSTQGLSGLLRPTVRGTTIREAITKPEFIAPASNVAINVGQAGAGQAINVARGGEFSFPEFATEAAVGTLFNRPTRLGRRLGLPDLPETPEPQKTDLARARMLAERPTEFATPREERLGIGKELEAPQRYFEEGEPVTEKARAKEYADWWKSQTEPTTDLIKQAADSVKVRIPKERINELANDPDVARVINDPTTLPEFVAKQSQDALQDAYENAMRERKLRERFLTAEERADIAKMEEYRTMAGEQRAAREAQVFEGITKDAQDLLRKVDEGGVPGFITNNLRRIASDNGITIEGADTPNSVISKIRAKATAAAEVPQWMRPTPEDIAKAERIQKENIDTAKLEEGMAAQELLDEAKQRRDPQAIVAAREIYNDVASRLQRGEGEKLITQADIDAAAQIAARRGLKIELDTPFTGSGRVRGMYLVNKETGNRIVRINPLTATPDTAIHEIGHDIFRGVTNPSMRKSLLETAQDTPAFKSELAARQQEVQQGLITQQEARNLALEEGVIQAFGEQMPNINRGELRSWFQAFKASTKQLITGKLSPEDAIAWLHYASTESVPWKGVAVPKATEQRMQRGEEQPKTISERRADAFERLKQSVPGSQAEMMESGRIFSPDVMAQLDALQAGGTLDREALQAAINRDIPVRKISEFSKKLLPDFQTIRDSLSDPRKKANVGRLSEIPAGSEMTLRQDVPAMTDFGVGVVTGTSGDVTTYEPFIRVRNIKMVPTKGMETQSLKIGAGAAKSPTIVAKGIKHESQTIPKDINTWTQVGFNPDRHSYFYDKADGVTPILGGDDAVQIGNTVFVKNPQTGDPTSFRYQRERMRGLSERVAASEEYPSEVRKEIMTSPESFYEQQRVEREINLAAKKTNLQLESDVVDSGSNTRTISGAELFRRSLERGDTEGANQIIKSLAKAGTTWGQLINQFKLIKGSTPEGVVYLVQKSLADQKRKDMTSKQMQTLVETSQKYLAAKDTLNAAKDRAAIAFESNDPNQIYKSAAEWDAADALRLKADMDLVETIARINPSSASDLFISMIQGSVMAPISIVRNVMGNALAMPSRMASATIAASIDNVISGNKNNPFSVRANVVDRMRAMADSLPEFKRVLLKGSNASPYEINADIGNPLNFQRAWSNIIDAWADKNSGYLQRLKNIGIRNIAEATVGVMPDIMLRLTQATDLPFRQSSRAAIISELGRRNGLSEAQLKLAIKDPENFLISDKAKADGRKGFTRDDIDVIENESARSVFQQDNAATRAVAGINRFIKEETGPIGYIPYRLISLFQKTPINVAAEALQYTPAGLLQFADWKNMSVRERNQAIGKVVVGGMVMTGFTYLYDKGVITPNLDTPGETNKARELAKAGGVMPPGTINMSGLRRLFNGEDPAFRPGDTIKDLSAFGTAGALGIIVGSAKRIQERSRTDQPDVTSMLKGGYESGVNFIMEQQFLKGTSNFLKLLSQESEATMERFIKDLNITALAPIAPATLGSIRRAQREYLPVTGGEGILKDTVNELNQRYAALKFIFPGAQIPGTKDPDAMPMRRNLWGEPVKQTAKNGNPWIDQFVDFWNRREIDADPLNASIYRVWRRTADNRVIPSIPNPEITVRNQTYQKLSPEQFDRYAQLVGYYRRMYSERAFMSGAYQQRGDEARIKILSDAYQRGLDHGKRRFLMELRQSGQQLTPIARRRGFEE